MTDLLYEKETAFRKGEKAGIARGTVAGALSKAREMAKEMRDEGISMDFIIRSSGLSEAEIRKL